MVINNAGLMNISPFVTQSTKEIENMFNVNVLSNFYVSSHVSLIKMYSFYDYDNDNSTLFNLQNSKS